MDLFDTSDLAAALDSTVFNVNCAVEVGLDFLSDSPADVGRRLTENIGQRMLAELDYVIPNGNGTTQPQGIFAASGVTSVPSTNGNAGPWTVADYEALMFSVGKQYRNRALRPVFLANDTTYSRARGIAVGASDQRRVFGMDHQSYSLLEHPFKVQNDIPNTRAAFGALAKYRMYRRVGQSVKFETGGKELTRKNLGLLVVRGRYGGRVVDANAFAKITDGQS
jgi:HK97 family phage major capsid protein